VNANARKRKAVPSVKNQRVIQVFVGSPGDVAEERKRAFKVIESINRR